MATFRRGQWVTTNRPLVIDLAPVAGQALHVTVPSGAVGIQHPLDTVKRDPVSGVITRAGRVYHREGGAPTTFEPDTTGGLVGLHLVDEATGFDTVLEAAVPADILSAVVERAQVPAPRLATYAADWSPKA